MGNNITTKDIKENMSFLDDRYDLLFEEAENIIGSNQSKFEGKNIDIGDIPISPMSLDDCDNNVFLSKEVVEQYKNILPRLVNPKTALEYGYLLVGMKDKNGNIKIDFMFDVGKKDSINNRVIKYDNAKINNIIEVMKSAGCNFFSICHTHPLIPVDERTFSVANFLSSDIIESECIRDVGLNLSLQDIISYNSLNSQMLAFDSSITCTSTIIMYNGEIVMFGINDGKITRYVNIFDENTKQQLPVSSSENYKRKSK